jgi:hypothetical protein
MMRSLEWASVGQDWIDNFGNTYDQMGDPAASAHWETQEQNFLSQIPVHLAKAYYLVLGLTGFTSAQKATVAGYINGLPVEDQERIVRLGF